MGRPTNLRAKIRIVGTGNTIEARPHDFGMLGNDGKIYHRNEYQIIKRWTVDDKAPAKRRA